MVPNDQFYLFFTYVLKILLIRLNCTYCKVAINSFLEKRKTFNTYLWSLSVPSSELGSENTTVTKTVIAPTFMNIMAHPAMQTAKG